MSSIGHQRGTRVSLELIADRCDFGVCVLQPPPPFSLLFHQSPGQCGCVKEYALVLGSAVGNLGECPHRAWCVLPLQHPLVGWRVCAGGGELQSPSSHTYCSAWTGLASISHKWSTLSSLETSHRRTRRLAGAMIHLFY